MTANPFLFTVALIQEEERGGSPRAEEDSRETAGSTVLRTCSQKWGVDPTVQKGSLLVGSRKQVEKWLLWKHLTSAPPLLTEALFHFQLCCPQRATEKPQEKILRGSKIQCT